MFVANISTAGYVYHLLDYVFEYMAIVGSIVFGMRWNSIYL